MAYGFLQHHAGALGQAHRRQAGADGAVHRRRGGEVGDQPRHRAQLVRQHRIAVRLEELHREVVQARHEALHHGLLQLGGRHVAAQVLADLRQALGRRAILPGQGEDARIGRQQPGAIQVIEGRKQLAQRQVTQGAEESDSARFNRS